MEIARKAHYLVQSCEKRETVRTPVVGEGRTKKVALPGRV